LLQVFEPHLQLLGDIFMLVYANAILMMNFSIAAHAYQILALQLSDFVLRHYKLLLYSLYLLFKLASLFQMLLLLFKQLFFKLFNNLLVRIAEKTIRRFFFQFLLFSLMDI